MNVAGLPIYVAATVMSVNHVNALKVQSMAQAPGEATQFVGTMYALDSTLFINSG